MKKITASFLAMAALGAVLGTNANAVPLFANLEAAPGSELSIAINTLGAEGGATTDITGTMNVLLDNAEGPVAAGLKVNASELSLSDESFVIDLSPLVIIEAVTVGVGVGANGPLLPATDIGGGVSIVDLAGTTLALNSGLITYEATAGAFSTALPPDSFDFNTDPLRVELPEGSTVTISEALVGTDTQVTVFIPLAVTETIDTEALGVPILGIVGGEITLTGIKVIPEPGTIVLLGLGAVGFIAIIARRRRKA